MSRSRIAVPSNKCQTGCSGKFHYSPTKNYQQEFPIIGEQELAKGRGGFHYLCRTVHESLGATRDHVVLRRFEEKMQHDTKSKTNENKRVASECREGLIVVLMFMRLYQGH